MYINMAPSSLKNCSSSVSCTILFPWLHFQRSKSVFRHSQLLIARKCVDKGALRHQSLFDFLLLEYGRQHVSPLRIYPFPSSRCHLHHPLRASDSPPCLPAYQDPRLVSNTHSHRRSLYADFASLPAHKRPLANQKLAVEWIGYIGRAISSQQGRDWTIGPYIMQSLLLLTAPLFFAASIYMSLARIAQGIGAEDRCIISPRWLTRIFVTGDVLSLLVVFGGERAKTLPRRCVQPNSWVDIVWLTCF